MLDCTVDLSLVWLCEVIGDPQGICLFVTVGISDPQGSLVTMHHLRIVLQDISSKPPSPAIAKRILSTVVTSNVPPPGQGLFTI